ncbi:hypothetical protein RI543_003458 [Arxiozyma heterogenica]|uniref:Las1p n=1 Tax=Arxiozyma heterogenica TaxID=278026 RepID=A0AAN7ZXQ0_9SACH|nr:hypothetical protein RI543_003458 [Kazachstania heterogenica]
MTHARIVPWKYTEEWEQLKNWFYSKSTEDQRRAILKVNSYQCKGSQYLPHVVDSTCQLTNAVLMDEAEVVDKLNVRLNYTMSLIRFVNGILDPNQKAQFAIPLHTIAKNVGLSSWFVELRHWGTHERDLPSLDMLRIAVKDALNWLWLHYWDDSELLEESEEDSDEDEEYSEEEYKNIDSIKIKAIVNLIKDWNHEYLILFKENKKNWMSTGDDKESIKKVISSENFVIEPQDNTHSNKNDKKLEKKRIEIAEKINEYVSLWQVQWQQSKNKSKFIEIVLNCYNPLLITMLISQLDITFSEEYFKWILAKYQKLIMDEQVKIPTLFKNFKTFEDLFKYTIKKNLKLLRTNDIISTYEEWLLLFDKETVTVLSYRFIQSIQEKIRNFGSLKNDDWRNKKNQRYRKKLNENKERQEKFKIKLDDILATNNRDPKNFESLIEEETNKYHELIVKRNKSLVDTNNRSTREVQNEKTNPFKSPTDTLDILNDLALLKKRLNRNKLVNQQTITITSIGHSSKPNKIVKRWSKVQNWTPKPFGQL